MSAELSIVVAGGGPVGLAIAALLGSGRAGGALRVRVLESREAPVWNPERLDLRVYALSHASRHVLEHVGVWEAVARARAAPYRRMHVWQGEHDSRLGSLVFDSAEAGEADLGHIVEDNLLRARLTAALAHAGSEVTFGAEVTSVRVRDRDVEIVTSLGERLTAAVLIAADGGASPVRSLLGMPVAAVSYPQRAVVTHVSTERPHAQTARQRFLPGGPLAFLPLSDGRSSVVWSMPVQDADRLSEVSDEAFLEELGAASSGVLGELLGCSERVGFPLGAAHACHYCRPRIALVGDAAHTVHPLAGQGMNLGLLDAAVLSDVLLEALRRGEDPGDLRVLRRYERRRKGDNLKTILALDGLHRLFRVPGPAAAKLRALGMSTMDALPFAKTLLMREASGLAGEIPAAARSAVAGEFSEGI